MASGGVDSGVVLEVELGAKLVLDHGSVSHQTPVPQLLQWRHIQTRNLSNTGIECYQPLPVLKLDPFSATGSGEVTLIPWSRLPRTAGVQ